MASAVILGWGHPGSVQLFERLFHTIAVLYLLQFLSEDITFELILMLFKFFFFLSEINKQFKLI